jgi:hypothetical protein
MTKDEKLQAIEDMGIDLRNDCPREYGLKDSVDECNVYNVKIQCGDCWTDALEGQSNETTK